jgi:hypothetical protein
MWVVAVAVEHKYRHRNGNADVDGMDEGSEGPKIKYRNMKYNLHFTICPRSTASRLPGLVVVLPPVLCRLSFLTRSLTTSHRALLDLCCGRLFFDGRRM